MMTGVEVIRLGAFETERNRREFDAVSYGRFFWSGLLSLETTGEEQLLVVYSDRSDLLGDDYACRPGSIEELTDVERAQKAIQKAVATCFDHTMTTEVISDGDGGWISLETDT